MAIDPFSAEARIMRFLPEIDDFITPIFPPKKLTADDYPSLSVEEVNMVKDISFCIEKIRNFLKEKHYREAEESGFLGKNTNEFEFMKWEELFLEKGVLEEISKKSNKRQKDILILIINKLYPEQPHLTIINQLLKEKNTPDKRENELHIFLMRVMKAMEGKKPFAKAVWMEVEGNYKEYDGNNIIQEVTDDAIYWVSSHGNEDSLSRSVFDKTISTLKTKMRK